MDDSNKTHFGFKKIDANNKLGMVADVFESVVDKYDLMNDIMSFGLHRIWKTWSIESMAVIPGQKILDIACGSADLAKKIAKKTTTQGEVHLLDLQWDMLMSGRANMLDNGFVENIFYSQADAQYLPYIDGYFDCVSIGFGLRNVPNIAKTLQEIQRVLRPGGKLMILEFSKADKVIEQLYEWYSFNCIPAIGEYIVKDKKSYEYLVESIKVHPSQEELSDMILKAGFTNCYYQNLNSGIVSMHMAFK